MRRCISAHTVLRMKWGLIGLSVLCVVTGSSCGGSKAPQPSGTVATAPPRTVVVTTVPVTSTSTLAAPTTSTSVVLGPGPTDAEIKAIIDDTDRREGLIYREFKKSLTISPAIDRLIIESFGPGADSVRTTLLAHQAIHGTDIQIQPKAPTSTILKIVSRSSECFIVTIRYDASPMIVATPIVLNEIFKVIDRRWYLLQEVDDSQINVLDGKSCDLI